MSAHSLVAARSDAKASRDRRRYFLHVSHCSSTQSTLTLRVKWISAWSDSMPLTRTLEMTVAAVVITMVKYVTALVCQLSDMLHASERLQQLLQADGVWVISYIDVDVEVTTHNNRTAVRHQYITEIRQIVEVQQCKNYTAKVLVQYTAAFP